MTGSCLSNVTGFPSAVLMSMVMVSKIVFRRGMFMSSVVLK